MVGKGWYGDQERERRARGACSGKCVQWPMADEAERPRSRQSGVSPQQSHPDRSPRSPKPATPTLSHHLFNIDMADEAFLLSSAALAGSSSGLASARAVGYTTQPKQTSRVVVLNPAVGLTVYDVSCAPPTQAMQSSMRLRSYVLRLGVAEGGRVGFEFTARPSQNLRTQPPRPRWDQRPPRPSRHSPKAHVQADR